MGNTRLVVAEHRQKQSYDISHNSLSPVSEQDVSAPADSGVGSSTQRDKTNPFLVACSALLTLMSQIKQCDVPPDLNKLHTQITTEIKIIVTKLKRIGFAKTMIDSACYCVCAALDEAILSTSWGTQSFWVQNSLLSLYNSETWGGERFYLIAETLAREPRRYIYVLELIYILLSLGFEGRFYGDKRMIRDEVRSRIFQVIRQSRGKIEKSLSVNWRDIQPQLLQKKKRHVLMRLVFWLEKILTAYNDLLF